MFRPFALRFASQWTIVPAAVVAVLLTASAAEAQLPVAHLGSIYPPGGAQGQSFDVTISGADLDDVTKLHFSHPGITAVQKMNPPGPFEKGPQPAPNQFTVTIAGNVPIGLYEARAIGRYGISSPRAFVVSDTTEVVEKEPNHVTMAAAMAPFSSIVEQAQEVPLGAVVSGITANKDDQDYFKFTASKGQRVLVDCWAQRIDSRLDGSLAVYDSKGRELGSSRDMNRRDPMVDFTAPADGVYVVKIWDSVYGGSAEYFYRLSISTAPYIDYIFPTAGQPGKKAKFTLYGRNLPGGKPADGLKIDGRPLEKLSVEIAIPSGPAVDQLQINSLVEPDDVSIDGFEYRIKGPGGHSNPVLVGFAQAPVVEEQEPNTSAAEAQRITPPCEYIGQFQKRGDQDWVTFEAKKGQVYSIDLIAKRQRSRTDPELIVQQVTVGNDGKENVRELQKVDDRSTNFGGSTFDTRSDDPVYRFVAPDDGQYRVLVKDLYQTGDPRSVYRLCIRPEAPDFRLAAVPLSRSSQNNRVLAGVPLLRKGGQAAIDVLAFRQDGFDGEIRVSAKGLPPGVTCPEVVIGPQSSTAPLVFHADENAKEWAGVIQVVGKATIGGKEVVREARGGSVIWPMQVQNNQSAEARMTRNIALAVSGVEQAPYNVEVAEAKVYEVSRAGKLEIPLKAKRRGDFKGAIAMTAVGLPPNLRINNFNIDGGKSDAKLTFDIPNNAPLGTYSFYLLGTSQVPYKRDPEAVAKAQEEKKELDKIVAELTEASKKAAQAKTDAEKEATTAAADAKKAADAKTAADKAAADAAAAVKAAEERFKTASEAAKEDAEKALNEARAKAKEADEAKSAAEKAAAEAAAKVKAAEEAKTAATTAANEAAAKLKMATDAQSAAAKRVTEAANKAKANNVNALEPSMPITISIAPAPITLAETSPAKVKQGDKVEVSVKINRLFGYADPVELEANLQGVKGVKVAKVTVPKGKSDGKLVIEAADDAAAGNHTITLRGTARLNGQNLTVEQPLALTVEAAPAEEKK